MNPLNRDEIWQLLCEYTQSDLLRKHCLAVEAAMKWYARKFGEDENLWGNIGLIHDFAYEKYPDQHPQKGGEILRELGFPEDWVRAIWSHGDALNIPRVTPLEKTLYAVDELTGLVIALSFHFFFTDDTSISASFFDGRTSATAMTSPVSSSTA